MCVYVTACVSCLQMLSKLKQEIGEFERQREEQIKEFEEYRFQEIKKLK